MTTLLKLSKRTTEGPKITRGQFSPGVKSSLAAHRGTFLKFPEQMAEPVDPARVAKRRSSEVGRRKSLREDKGMKRKGTRRRESIGI